MSRLPIAPFVLSLSLLSCGDLAAPPTSQRADPPSVQVLPAPTPEDGTVAPVLTLAVHGASSANVFLLRGRAGAKSIAQLADGVPSSSVRDRLVPIFSWQDSSSRVNVALERPLELGSEYAVVIPSLGWTHPFQVMKQDRIPTLARIWPPKQTRSGARYAVWCSPKGLSGQSGQWQRSITLQPGDVAGTIASGALAQVGAGCVHWRTDRSVDHPLVPPASTTIQDGSIVRLEPGTLGVNDVDDHNDDGCRWSDAIETGGLCLKVLDDRIWVTSAGPDKLVGLRGGDVQIAGLVSAGHVVALQPIKPNSRVSVQISILNAQGDVTNQQVDVFTRQPMDHLVISEVMADAVGPEPCQEWVEVFNDGGEDTDLEGWLFQDSASSTMLPHAIVPSGGYALLVNDCFDEDSWVDTKPANGTAIVRVGHLGKSGLSNSGEPVRLVGPGGHVASAVPAIRPKKAGWSVARRANADPSDDRSAFGYSPDGGTPGMPNGQVYELP